MDWNKWFKYYDDGTLCRLYTMRSSTTQKVGWINNKGYYQTEFEGKTYMLHRIVWEMHNGEIPEGFVIDHINRNKLDNRIENLRLATKTENMQNKTLNKNNTTGYKGVVSTPNGKFQARLNANGKKLYLGLFDTAKEAADCVQFHREQLHGEFAIVN